MRALVHAWVLLVHAMALQVPGHVLLQCEAP